MSQSADESAVRAQIVVHGCVQGVGYRAFTARAAVRLKLVGGVRNTDDGLVEVEVEGRKTVIEALIGELTVGPPAAQVTRIETEWSQATGRFSTFTIWYSHKIGER